MNVFSENDYRRILTRLVDERKSFDETFSFQRLAEALRIQKSYLSRVVNGRADLSADQLYSAAEFFELRPHERRYWSLLLEHERSALRSRRDSLMAEITDLQSRYLDTREHLAARSVKPEGDGLVSFYFDPLHAVVHCALSVPRYQKDAMALAADLGVTNDRVRQSVRVLEELGLIAKEKGKWKVIEQALHLPPDAPIYRTWRDQLRLMSMPKLQNARKESSYSFSVTFSATPETRRKLQALFLEWLKDCEPVVRKAMSGEVYQMNFDLFSWTE